MPEATIWKIGHDISAGLSHIHSHGWHELRRGGRILEIQSNRSHVLIDLINNLLDREPANRPTADAVLGRPHM